MKARFVCWFAGHLWAAWTPMALHRAASGAPMLRRYCQRCRKSQYRRAGMIIRGGG